MVSAHVMFSLVGLKHASFLALIDPRAKLPWALIKVLEVGYLFAKHIRDWISSWLCCVSEKTFPCPSRQEVAQVRSISHHVSEIICTESPCNLKVKPKCPLSIEKTS